MKKWIITLTCALSVLAAMPAGATVLTFNKPNGTVAASTLGANVNPGYGKFVQYTVQDGFSYGIGTVGSTPDVNVAYLGRNTTYGNVLWKSTGAAGETYGNIDCVVYPWITAAGSTDYADMVFTFQAVNGKQVKLKGFDLACSSGGYFIDWDVKDNTGKILARSYEEGIDILTETPQHQLLVDYYGWGDPNMPFHADPNKATIPWHRHVAVDANLANGVTQVVSPANGKLILTVYTSYLVTDAPLAGISNIEFGEIPQAAAVTTPQLPPAPIVAPTILTFDNADGTPIASDWGSVPQNYGDNVAARTQNGYSYGGNGSTPDVSVAYAAVSAGASGPYIFFTNDVAGNGYADLTNVIGAWNSDLQITFTGSNEKKSQLYGFDLGAFSGLSLPIHWKVTDGASTLAEADLILNNYPANTPATHVNLDPNSIRADTLILTVATTNGDQAGDFAIDNIGIGQYSITGPPQAACGDSLHPKFVGDFNGDCYVNFKDLSLLSRDWLTCTSPNPPCNYHP